MKGIGGAPIQSLARRLVEVVILIRCSDGFFRNGGREIFRLLRTAARSGLVCMARRFFVRGHYSFARPAAPLLRGAE